jgi:hypothetical protein
MTVSVFIGAAAAALAAVAALRKKRKAASLPDVAPPSSLPPVSRFEAEEAMADAEKAAIEEALGGRKHRNPYPQGTRAHIIWEAHHGATLLDWQHDDRPEATR